MVEVSLKDQIKEDNFQNFLTKGDLFEARYWLNRIRPYSAMVGRKDPLKLEIRATISRLESELDQAEVALKRKRISTSFGLASK